jgi:hypothetical protein
MALKAGRVLDFDSSLAAAMETAMGEEWLAVRGEPMPQQGRDDRRIMFAAVARGLFTFLDQNEDALITGITLRSTSGSITDTSWRVVQLELDL